MRKVWDLKRRKFDGDVKRQAPVCNISQGMASVYLCGEFEEETMLRIVEGTFTEELKNLDETDIADDGV